MRSATIIAIVVLMIVPAGIATALAPPRSSEGPHVMPSLPALRAMHAAATPGVSPAAVTNLNYGGGAVQHSPKVYLVFWGWHGVMTPAGQLYGTDPYGVGPYLVSFFQGVGGSPWANIQTQYYDGTGHITNPTNQLAGVWFDDSGTYDPYTDGANGPQFVGNEAQRAVAHFGYSADANYFIALPPGADYHGRLYHGYCAWHWDNVRDPAGRPIAYTNMPYVPDIPDYCGTAFVNKPGLLDPVSIVGGHEYAEVVTDPFLNAWWDWSNGQENGDKCAWNTGPGAPAQNIVLSTGTFAVQSLWSNEVSRCAIHRP